MVRIPGAVAADAAAIAVAAASIVRIGVAGIRTGFPRMR